MLVVSGIADSTFEAKLLLQTVIEDGSALDKLKEFVAAQGGDASYVDDTSKFTLGAVCEEIPALSDGFITAIDCDEIGICSLILGGGRETKESEIDLGVGLVLHKKKGDYVKAGESLATIYGNDPEKVKTAIDRFRGAYHFGAEAGVLPPFIHGYVEEDGTVVYGTV